MLNTQSSAVLLAQARECLAGGVNSNVRAQDNPPLFFARGEGARILDVDGNEYLDFTLGQGPLILGHSPARVLAAARAQLERGLVFAAQCEAEVAVAQQMVRMVPCAELVRFVVSGTEADQLALRLARAFTGRTKFIKFEGHYHGWSDSLLFSNNPDLELAGPRENPQPVSGSQGQVASARAELIVLPWNDLGALETALVQHGHEVAAVIMEPMPCNVGAIRPRPGYLEGARELCTRHGCLLIFDEVITGFRLALGGAQERFGVVPDLATFGKAMAAGFPLAAVAGRREVMALMDGRGVFHGGTFNGSPVTMAAAQAALEELAADGGAVYRRLYALGDRLRAGLQARADQAGVPVKAGGMGPVVFPYFTAAPEPYDWRSFKTGCDHQAEGRFVWALLDRGVRVINRGLWYLSTAHTEQDVDRALAAAEGALADLARAGSASR